MFPEIVVFNQTFSLYTIASTIGVLVAGFFACRQAKRQGLADDDMIAFLLIAAIGVLLGGHLLYGVVNIGGFARALESGDTGNVLLDFGLAVYYTFGGSVFYGGLLGGMAVGALYARHKQLPFAKYCDIMAVTVPLFHVFGRIGCFLGGCCYGKESDFGILYTHALVEQANGVVRFPIQLVEAAFNVLLFVALYALQKRRMFTGRLFSLYLLAYSVGRFLIEFGRGDDYRGFVLGISVSQLISIGIFAAVIAYWLASGSKRLPQDA